MSDAQYIGSLVMEKIKPRPKGEPSIELVISSDKNGEIIADAVDLDTSVQGEHQVLSVSLKSMDEDNREYDLPDFELEQSEGTPSGLLSKAGEIEAREKGRKNPLIIIICVVIALLVIGLLVWFFLLRDKDGSASAARQTSRPPAAAPAPAEQTPAQPAAPVQPRQTQPQPAAQTPPPIQTPPPVQTPPPAQTTQPQTVQAPPPVIQAPSRAPAPVEASRQERPRPPVASYRVPSVIPREGAPYTIRWGDTLWDISEAFYRNPWLYPRIARFNNIRNPDLIISGTTIRVPPRN